MHISFKCFLLLFIMLAIVLLPLLCYPLGCEANSLSLNSGLGTWPALRSVAVEQSRQISFPRVNWLCWIPLCSNPAWAPASQSRRVGTSRLNRASCLRSDRKSLLAHFCSPNSARMLLSCRGTPSTLSNRSLLKWSVASSSSQRRAPVEVFCLACFRLRGGTVAKNDVTAH